ncbi:MAG: efflux transporter outer membrane subunit [Acidobacteria bacterium]|nr:efflux transporter outer membrane subunit [Acidobacteriota bacterium]
MKKFYRIKFVAIIILLAVSAGCKAVGPNYAPVRVNTPAEWPSIEASDSVGKRTAETKALAEWWTTLEDPLLSDLVKKALANNKDLKIALTRVRQSRAALGVANKQLDPSVSGSALYRRTQSGMPTSGNEDPALFSSGNDYYDAGFDASWEVDLFGKKHRSIEAATAELEASEEGFRSVQVSLISETASNYVRLRTYQKQLEIVRRNLELQEKALAVLEDLAAVGLISDLQVQQSRYNIENTKSRIPGYRISIEESMNTLAILLGEMPGDLHRELSDSGPIPVPGVEIAVGIPADILRRRPDIRNAERMLAAQTARIGAATADLYPAFTLSGFLGMTASSFSAFFSDDSPAVSIAPFISLPIFNRDKIRDQIEIQNAIQERYLIEYETIVLDAIREVRDAIIAYGEEQKRYRILEKGAADARSALSIADEQFRSGLVNFLNVLDAQRSLLSFEETQISSQGTITQNLIKLYKSLGGGWDPEAHGRP